MGLIRWTYVGEGQGPSDEEGASIRGRCLQPRHRPHQAPTLVQQQRRGAELKGLPFNPCIDGRAVLGGGQCSTSCMHGVPSGEGHWHV